MRETKTTNPQLIEVISLLRKQSKEQEAPIWIDVADYLAKTRSQRVVVNLSTSTETQRKTTLWLFQAKSLPQAP
jgi:ribosomal protein L18E